MNLKEALYSATNMLKNCEIESPASEAGILLCYVLEKDKIFIYAHDDYIMTKEQKELYKELLFKRLQGTPIQYLTGRQEFMSLLFKVQPGVLIPRQDTETLVEAIIECAAYIGKASLSILDMCTGSGCIALSLAHYIKNSHITASDISKEALSVAENNAEHLGLRDKVRFVQSDLFESFVNGNAYEKFDIIVSNPPYIPASHIAYLKKEVKDFEPILALNGGIDGLFYYKKIISQAPAFLKANGRLAFEVGINQSLIIQELMFKGGFKNIKIIKDIASIDRVVIAHCIQKDTTETK